MKGILAAGAILGVLAVGGLPAFALTMAADPSSGSGSTADTQTWQPGDGAPPWSDGRHAKGHAKWHQGESDDDVRGAGELPPGLAKTGKTHHGAQMRDWAHCMAGAEKPTDHKCGAKPTPPGHDEPDD